MEQVVLHQLLEKANSLFQDVGIGLVHEEQIAAALDLTPASFRSAFGSKAELILQVSRYTIARQQHEHTLLFANLGTPVECLLAWVHHSLQELRRAPYFEYDVVRQQYPQVWEALQQYIREYAYPLLTRLLQEGILEGQFRSDLNAPLIAHIMLAQFNMVLDEQVFPPDQISPVEAYRNIFFYYVRGLCTPEGIRLATAHLNKM